MLSMVEGFTLATSHGYVVSGTPPPRYARSPPRPGEDE